MLFHCEIIENAGRLTLLLLVLPIQGCNACWITTLAIDARREGWRRIAKSRRVRFSSGQRHHDIDTSPAQRYRSTVDVASKARHVEVLRIARRGRHPRPGAAWGAGRVVHEFLAWLLRGRT